jgi:hypothetical protein
VTQGVAALLVLSLLSLMPCCRVDALLFYCDWLQELVRRIIDEQAAAAQQPVPSAFVTFRQALPAGLLAWPSAPPPLHARKVMSTYPPACR